MTKEERKEYMRKYHQEHKEERRKYNQEHKEEIRVCCNKYCQKNRKKILDYQRKYYQEHKERIKEYYQKYVETHKDKVAIKNKRLYDRAITKYKTMLGGKCEYCGTTENLHFHHIDKSTKEFDITSKVGYKDISNEVKKCILLCRTCHRALHAKLSREEKERKRAEQDKQDTSK